MQPWISVIVKVTLTPAIIPDIAHILPFGFVTTPEVLVTVPELTVIPTV